MRRLLHWLITPLLALALILPATAVTDYGDPALTRLWTANGDFACTGFYFQGPKLPKTALFGGNQAWLATAGHCTDVVIKAGKDAYAPRVGLEWRANGWPRVDTAAAVVEDIRANVHNLKLADRDPEAGDPVYIHGFGVGVENVIYGIVAGPFPPAPHVTFVKGISGRIWPGNSGSPLLNSKGEVAGIVVAIACKPGTYCQEYDPTDVLIVPVSVLKGLLA